MKDNKTAHDAAVFVLWVVAVNDSLNQLAEELQIVPQFKNPYELADRLDELAHTLIHDNAPLHMILDSAAQYVRTVIGVDIVALSEEEEEDE